MIEDSRLDALANAAAALDPDADERRVLHDAIHDLAERYVSSLQERPGFVAGAVSPSRELGPKPTGATVSNVISYLEEQILAKGGHPASPMHLAYISGGGLYHTALADYLSSAANKFAGLSATGPGPVEIERNVVGWAADLVGYPAGASGNIASGGSLATFSAVVTARDAHGIGPAEVPRAVVYISDQTHGCLEKSLHLAGLGEATIRRIPTDAGFRMSATELTRQIADDRAAGLRPWLIVATAGSVDTGAVDDVSAIADVAEAAGCWFHVDAAYGGFFLLTDRGRRLMEGINRSDSVVLDPHKSLFTSWGAGIVLTRDGARLAAAHSLQGAYLPEPVENTYSPADLSPELTRPFRALGTWLPLVLAGTDAFAAVLEEKLLLAKRFYDGLLEAGYDVTCEPDLSTVAFRFSSPGLSDQETEAINRRLVRELQHESRLFVSATTIRGWYTIRGTILNFRTHRRHVDEALALLGEHASRLAQNVTHIASSK